MKEKTLREIGEFGLINRIRKWVVPSDKTLIRGIGDDVAVVQMANRTLLLTTDILIEGIHFERSWMDPYRLGKKALGVNLSDIAAMGGIPKYFLLSLGLSRSLPMSFLSLFYRGLMEEGKRHRVTLVGGDSSLSPRIVINLCLLGEGDRGRLLYRNGAKAGEDLYVSGTLGDASLGLKFLKKKGGRRSPKGLIEKHLSPCPRVELGQALASRRLATAMIDVSDGLLIDTSHLLEESRVGARIWEDRIPLSRLYREWVHLFSKDLYPIALTGGEDYELLFTAPAPMRRRIATLSRSFKIPITRIGEILPEGKGFHIVNRQGGSYSPSSLGFDHFK